MIYKIYPLSRAAVAAVRQLHPRYLRRRSIASGKIGFEITRTTRLWNWPLPYQKRPLRTVFWWELKAKWLGLCYLAWWTFTLSLVFFQWDFDIKFWRFFWLTICMPPPPSKLTSFFLYWKCLGWETKAFSK